MADKLPPLTVPKLIEELKNPNFKAYVFIGTEDDRGWHLALSAQKMLAGVRVYLVTSDEEKAFRKEFHVKKDCVGIAFGWGTDIHAQLDDEQAEDFLIVTEAIDNA